jgi:hypothetical protein
MAVRAVLGEHDAVDRIVDANVRPDMIEMVWPSTFAQNSPSEPVERWVKVSRWNHWPATTGTVWLSLCQKVWNG